MTSKDVKLVMCRTVQVAALALAVTGSALAQGPKSKLPAPTNVTVSSTIGALIVNWTPVFGVASYLVNRRYVGSTVVTQLGQVAAPPFNTRPPVPGVAFEYQVVAVAKYQAASAWVPYTIPTTTTAVLMPPPTTTVTVAYAGPTALTAQGVGVWEIGGAGQCALRWSLVTNAVKYRVMRSSPIQTEQMVAELSAVSQDPAYYDHTDTVNANLAYSYRVFAVLSNGATTLPSPLANCWTP